MEKLTLKEIQKRIWENKVKKGFNITDIGLDFLSLTEELGEAVRAYRKENNDELAEEIVDIMIYCFGILTIMKRDVYSELMKKTEKNEKREYSGKKGSWRHLRKDQK